MVWQKSTSKHDLQVVSALMCDATQVVPTGRPSIRNLIDAISLQIISPGWTNHARLNFLVAHLHRGMKWDRPISPPTWGSLHLYQCQELEISSLWPIQSVIRHGPESGPCLMTDWMAQLNVCNQYSCQGALAHSGYMGALLCRHKRSSCP